MVLFVELEVELGRTRVGTNDEEGVWIVATNASTAYDASTVKQRTRVSGEKVMLHGNDTRCFSRRTLCSPAQRVSCFS